MNFLETYNDGFVMLSGRFAEFYKQNPKVFISCVLKFKGFRGVCSEIVSVYKKLGIFKECQETGKDFTEYAEKVGGGQVLADILLIIYSILHV